MNRVYLKPLHEQVIVITGASSGIGLATARAAAAKGATVFLVARDAPALADIVQGIEAAGGKAAYGVADVGDFDQVAAVAEACMQHFGRIDSWINNAGVALYAKLVETPMNEHWTLFRTNYFGMVHGTLAAISHLRTKGGALVTVGSIASDIPSPLMGAYAASKHAIAAYIHSLRIEMTSDDLPIVVTFIKPSGIDTPIAEHAASHVDGAPLIPAPVYDPSVVARAILDACQTPRRDMTVGGFGRLQTLLVQHFPRVLDHLGRVLDPMLHDRQQAAQPSSNFHEPKDNGRERSRRQTGRPFSIYTGVARHRFVMAVASVSMSVGIAWFLSGRLPSRKRSDQ